MFREKEREIKGRKKWPKGWNKTQYSKDISISKEKKIDIFVRTTKLITTVSWPGVDPTKLFFFDNKEMLRFSLVSLHFCYIQKKIIESKMT